MLGNRTFVYICMGVCVRVRVCVREKACVHVLSHMYASVSACVCEHKTRRKKVCEYECVGVHARDALIHSYCTYAEHSLQTCQQSVFVQTNRMCSLRKGPIGHAVTVSA